MKVLIVDPQLTIGRINFISLKIHEVFVRLEKLGIEWKSQRFWLSQEPLSLENFEKAEKEFFAVVADNITNNTIVMIRLVITSFERAVRLAHFLRTEHPDITIIYGGSAATLLSNQAPALNPLYFAPVNALIIGEADITFPEYVQAIMAGSKTTVGVKTLADQFMPRPYLCLETLSPLNFEILKKSVGNYPTCPLNELKVEIAASRGCPRKCSFCEMSAMHRCQNSGENNSYRPQGVNSTMGNLKHLCECGIRKIFFSDLIFPWQKEWLNALKAAEVVNKFKEVGIYTTTDKFIQQEYLEKLVCLGITKISIGIETVTNRLLKLVGKPVVSLRSFESALKKAKALDIDIRLAWILGLPTETLAEVKASIGQAINWSDLGLVKEHDFHNFYPRLDQIGQGAYSHLGKEYLLQAGRYNLPTNVLPDAIKKYGLQWKWGHWPEHFIQQIARTRFISPTIVYGSSKVTIRELVELTKKTMKSTYSGLTDPW